MRMIPILVMTFSLVLFACGGEVDGDNIASELNGDNIDNQENNSGENNTGENNNGSGELGTVALKWSAPIENVDSSCTDDLSSFEIHYGNIPGQYTDSMVLSVDEASCTDSTNVTACGTIQVCSYTLTGLPADSWYIAISAHDLGGNESLYSNEIKRVVSN